MQAARQWRRVRALADQLDQTPETVELGINARLMILGRLWRIGAASEEGLVPYEEEAATLFAEGEKFADATGQAAVKVFFLCLYGVVRYMGEAVEDGYQYSLRATQLADEIGDPGLRVNARMPLAFSLYRLGRLREAAAVAEEMIPIIGEDRSLARGVVVPSPYGWCRLTRAIFAAHASLCDDSINH